MKTTDDILAERGKTHGDYAEHARITQDLKELMRANAGWLRLSQPQRESLEMVAHKIGRILAGDPNVADHWADVCGYSRLIERQIQAHSSLTPPATSRAVVDINALATAIHPRGDVPSKVK